MKNTESFSERSAYNTYKAMFWRRIGMKTKEELNTLKEEVETLNKKLAELTEEELAQVSGGDGPDLNLEPGLFEVRE